MPTFRVVEAFDVLEDRQPRFSSRVVVRVVGRGEGSWCGGGKWMARVGWRIGSVLCGSVGV